MKDVDQIISKITIGMHDKLFSEPSSMIYDDNIIIIILDEDFYVKRKIIRSKNHVNGEPVGKINIYLGKRFNNSDPDNVIKTLTELIGELISYEYNGIINASDNLYDNIIIYSLVKIISKCIIDDKTIYYKKIFSTVVNTNDKYNFISEKKWDLLCEFICSYGTLFDEFINYLDKLIG